MYCRDSPDSPESPDSPATQFSDGQSDTLQGRIKTLLCMEGGGDSLSLEERNVLQAGP